MKSENRHNKIIELKSITKKYGTDEESIVLKDLSVGFDKGLTTAILGTSGSGKTTLLNLIGGIDSEFQGEFFFGDEAIHDFDKYRREHVSFIFQELNLISHLSLVKNITIGLTNDVEHKEEKARELLKQVGLVDHADKMPHQLSGGERQRVAIARALARDTDVLLCDEPTGSLDEETKVEIMDLIIDVFSDKTVIIITHDEELASKYSDVIYKLGNQTMIEVYRREGVAPLHQKDGHQKDGHQKEIRLRSFRFRFERNLLARKLSILNASFLLIIIASIFIFGTGIVEGVEQEIDNYIYDKYKVDKIDIRTKGLTRNGIKGNIEDFNELYDSSIHAVMLSDFIGITYTDKVFGSLVMLNSLQPAVRNTIGQDITYGRYPEKSNEILFSRGSARRRIFEYHSFEEDSEEELNRLYDWMMDLSDEALFNELSSIEISYKNVSMYSGSQFYAPEYTIVGIIDDHNYYQEYNFPEDPGQKSNMIFGIQMNSYNLNTKLTHEYDNFSKDIFVNDNIYILEEEFSVYLDQMYFSNTGKKFTHFSLFTDGENLDQRNLVFSNFLLFKSLFKGQDHITKERELYYKEVYGYKIAILGGCAILSVFALLSIYNGIKMNVIKNRKNIGIYKAIGYSSKNIKAMFFLEGIFIALFVALSTMLLWYIINIVMNEHVVRALDPNRILIMKRVIHLDIYSLLAVIATVVLIIIASINKELRKVNIINLLRHE